MWDFGDGTTANYFPGFNPVHGYLDTGIYQVQLFVQDLGGCPDSFALDVCVDPAATIFAPNGFSPNYDGKNDEFMVVGIGIVEFRTLIYNRWGELLFESHDMNTGWDGTYNGGPVENDVYTYLVLYKDMTDDRQKRLKGVVAVIR
jgi:gliding motility-associated-like protein